MVTEMSNRGNFLSDGDEEREEESGRESFLDAGGSNLDLTQTWKEISAWNGTGRRQEGGRFTFVLSLIKPPPFVQP